MCLSLQRAVRACRSHKLTIDGLFSGTDCVRQLVNSSSSSVLPVSNSDVPLLAVVVLPPALDPTSFQCRFWNTTSLSWSSAGTVLVGCEQDSVSGTVTCTCATSHLTDFSGRVDTSFFGACMVACCG